MGDTGRPVEPQFLDDVWREEDIEYRILPDSSGVSVRHRPTGLFQVCQEHPVASMNRDVAVRELRAMLTTWKPEGL